MGQIPEQRSEDSVGAEEAAEHAAPDEGLASHPAAEKLKAKVDRLARKADDLQESAHEQAAKARGAAKAAVATGALAATVAASATPAAAAAKPAATASALDSAADAQIPAVQTTKASPGVAKLDKMCGDSDAAICKTPKWTEERLQFDTVLISRYVNATWPQIKMVGGWRPSDPFPDHPSGRAVDIMMPNDGKGGDKALGDEIAKYFQQNAKEFGVDYILWRQKSWTAGDPIDGWKNMADRGSPTANHVDHIHITVKGNKSTIVKELLAGGAGTQASPASSTTAGLPGREVAQTLNETKNSETIVKALYDEQV